ncbi:MAG: TRAP transporter substrate-binding protein DctP, partial [Acetobacteraceae bacterium]|nr:TRAP transporter substrate-binding protein DctP [Acetobacteraceae bacterium]
MRIGISRRQLTALAGGTLASAAVRTRQAAAAAELVFKVGTNVPESHPLNVYLLKAFEEIKTTSGGRLEFQLFANNQLGGDSDMLSQLRSGALECFLNSGGNVLSTLNSSVAISGTGFAFKGYPAVWSAMDGKLGEYLRGRINKVGLVVMEKMVKRTRQRSYQRPSSKK